jgi:hypothetical protein
VAELPSMRVCSSFHSRDRQKSLEYFVARLIQQGANVTHGPVWSRRRGVNQYPQINNYRQTRITKFRMKCGVKDLWRNEETYLNELTITSLNHRRTKSEVSTQLKHEGRNCKRFVGSRCSLNFIEEYHISHLPPLDLEIKKKILKFITRPWIFIVQKAK